MATIYKWRPGTRLKCVDAQAAGDEIDRIAQRGKLSTSTVLAAAQRESSPLHAAFTWDDTAAAKKCREEEARYLLRSIVSISVKGAPETRAFVSIRTSDDEVDDGWYPTTEAVENPSMRAVLLGDAKRCMADFRRKYRHLKELCGVIDAIDKALA